MSQWSEAFAELVRLVQPDLDPTLSQGAGEEPDEDMELDQILLASAQGVTWSAGLEVTYGQTIFPAARMGRRFKVTKAGTLGSTEPSWPDYDYASVSDGTATLVEDGQDFGSIYDVRRAAYAALDLKVKKKMTGNNLLSEGRGQASSYDYLNLVRERDRFQSIGVA